MKPPAKLEQLVTFENALRRHEFYKNFGLFKMDGDTKLYAFNKEEAIVFKTCKKGWYPEREWNIETLKPFLEMFDIEIKAEELYKEWIW